MEQAEAGDTVFVHFVGMYRDGNVFASTDEGEPYEFTIGQGETIPGFEAAVVSMSPGEEKAIRILPDRGMGIFREEAVIEIQPDATPEHDNPDFDQSMPTLEEDINLLTVESNDVFEPTPDKEQNMSQMGEEVIYRIKLIKIKKAEKNL